MNKRFALPTILVIVSALLAGCWDQVQIEERGFVVGIAIDAPRTKEVEKRAAKEAPRKPKVKQRFLVTHQLVIPGGLIAGSQGGGGGQNTTNEAFLNLTSEGDSLFEVSRELATRTSRAPFYQHLKVLVISEEVARTPNGFANAMDFLLRDPDSRRSGKVFIANGLAKSIIEVKPKTEKLPSLYINSIGENIEKNARMLPEVRIGDIHEELLNPFSFVIPRVRAEKNEIKMAGSAVFSLYNQMVGFLGEEETEGLNFLTGSIDGGLLKAKVKGDLVVLNIQGTKHEIVQDLRDKQNFKFTIKIECEGILAEAYALMDFLSKEETKKLERAFAKEIERMCLDTLQKVHKEMKVDVIKLGSNIRQKEYSLWKQIQKDWESGQRLYEKSTIKVEAKVYLRNVGSVNRSEKEEGR
ncbi:Ger(x)C family spore germination protein [Brevibacillus parabrevis]|uniref:Ger(x)C family spore germination protein n=1 Tax=Brevibacillus parabrevis TaxID=54914 RepID=UPI001F6081C0|nr:Ger(x)C family spore germination protein [Brevibacillus parabrevis]